MVVPIDTSSDDSFGRRAAWIGPGASSKPVSGQLPDCRRSVRHPDITSGSLRPGGETSFSGQHDLGTYAHENSVRILFWTESSKIDVGDNWRMLMAAVQEKSFTGKVAPFAIIASKCSYTSAWGNLRRGAITGAVQ